VAGAANGFPTAPYIVGRDHPRDRPLIRERKAIPMATTATETVSEPEVETDEAEPEFPPHIITIDRYKRLIESGVYGSKDPVFLWNGRLVEKMTKGDPHAFSSSSLVGMMNRLIPVGWAVRPDQPIVLSDNSMPEPDLTIVRGSLRDYVNRTPTASDVPLVVEVSVSSLRIDSGAVLKAYASNRIPIYWIINIPKCRVEVYTQPTGPTEKPTYQDYREYGPDDEISVVLDGQEIGRIVAKEILP
jgi:Uma2 family endonuclease